MEKRRQEQRDSELDTRGAEHENHIAVIIVIIMFSQIFFSLSPRFSLVLFANIKQHHYRRWGGGQRRKKKANGKSQLENLPKDFSFLRLLFGSLCFFFFRPLFAVFQHREHHHQYVPGGVVSITTMAGIRKMFFRFLCVCISVALPWTPKKRGTLLCSKVSESRPVILLWCWSEAFDIALNVTGGRWMTQPWQRNISQSH